MEVKVGQVFRSRDHRNHSAPYLRVKYFTVGRKMPVLDVRFVVVQRFEDRELTKPKGKPVPIRETALESPAYEEV